jgi:hypothetical protein
MKKKNTEGSSKKTTRTKKVEESKTLSSLIQDIESLEHERELIDTRIHFIKWNIDQKIKSGDIESPCNKCFFKQGCTLASKNTIAAINCGPLERSKYVYQQLKDLNENEPGEKWYSIPVDMKYNDMTQLEVDQKFCLV